MNEAMWFSVLGGFALKSTVVLGVAWLPAIGLRRHSAAIRHLVWTAAAAAVLALPFFSLSLPSLRLPGWANVAPGAVAFFESTATPPADSVSGMSARGVVPVHAGSLPARPDWRRVLLLAWAIGAAALLVQMLLAFAEVWRARRSAEVVHGEWEGQLVRELGIQHPVEVLGREAGSMPMTCGLIRPAIFLPADAETWTPERRRMVLLHELAHVQRGDVVTQIVARVAFILNWWNPLAWVAWREFLKERERAADDLVLATGARASDYAAHLLEVARSMHSGPVLAWAAVAMARRSQLEGRLVAILDSGTNRRAAGRASVLAAVVVAIALAAPFAAVRAQDDKQTIPSDINETIRAATAQRNVEMLDKPAAALEARLDFEPARKLLDAALAIREQTSGSQSVRYGLGLMKLGDLESRRHDNRETQRHTEEASTFYLKAVQVLGDRPEAAPAWIHLGEYNLAKKDYAQAFDDFQKAQTLDAAKAGQAQMWMAVVRAREDNVAAAETLYRSALAAEDPGSADAATTLQLYSRFLNEQGQATEAQSMAGRASEIRKALGAQAAPVKTEALHIGNGVVPPKLLSKVEPEYTLEARAAQYQGTVVLFVEVGSDGVARNIRVVRGLGLGLDENAASAVQLWHFQPATKDGAPVAVVATIEVNFRLK